MKRTKLFILSLAVVFTAGIGFAAVPAKPAAAFAVPKTVTTFAAEDDTKKDEGFDKVCEEKSALGWLVCPIINGMNEGIQALYGFILDRLQFTLLQPVSNEQSGKSGLNEASFNALRTSWQIMARIATALLVIIFMVMLIAQAMSFNFVSAYTAKSLVPKIVVAIGLIATSPYWMPAGIEIGNIVAGGARDIILTPFAPLAGGGADKDALFNSPGNLSSAALVGIMAAGLVAFAVAPLVLLPLVLSVLSAVLMGMVFVVFRQAALMLLFVTTPLAVTFWVFPNTKKYANFWQNTYVAAIVIYILFESVLAIGGVLAIITGARSRTNDDDTMSLFTFFIVIICYFGPYFLLPKLAQVSSGILGRVAGVMNDRSKGFLDRSKNWAREKNKQQYQNWRQGQATTLLGRNNRAAQFLNRRGHAMDRTLRTRSMAMPFTNGQRRINTPGAGQARLDYDRAQVAATAPAALDRYLTDDERNNKPLTKALARSGLTREGLQREIAEARRTGRTSDEQTLTRLASSNIVNDRNAFGAVMRKAADLGGVEDSSLQNLQNMQGMTEAARRSLFNTVANTAASNGQLQYDSLSYDTFSQAMSPNGPGTWSGGEVNGVQVPPQFTSHLQTAMIRPDRLSASKLENSKFSTTQASAASDAFLNEIQANLASTDPTQRSLAQAQISTYAHAGSSKNQSNASVRAVFGDLSGIGDANLRNMIQAERNKIENVQTTTATSPSTGGGGGGPTTPPAGGGGPTPTPTPAPSPTPSPSPAPAPSPAPGGGTPPSPAGGTPPASPGTLYVVHGNSPPVPHVVPPAPAGGPTTPPAGGTPRGGGGGGPAPAPTPTPAPSPAPGGGTPPSPAGGGTPPAGNLPTPPSGGGSNSGGTQGTLFSAGSVGGNQPTLNQLRNQGGNFNNGPGGRFTNNPTPPPAGGNNGGNAGGGNDNDNNAGPGAGQGTLF